MAPADGAVGEHVEEGRARRGDGALDLDAQVVPVRRGRLRDVRDVVGDGDRGHVLSLLGLAPALGARRARGRARGEWRGAGALHAGVHVRLVVVADEQEAVAALERAGERLQADVVGAAVAREDDDRDLLVGRQRMSPAEGALRALDAARDGGGVLEGDVQPRHVPGCRRVAGRRDLEAAGRVDDDDRARDRAEDGADDERDAAALAERVAAAQRGDSVLVPDECLQTRHAAPRSPMWERPAPANTARMSSGCRSRPPSP